MQGVKSIITSALISIQNSLEIREISKVPYSGLFSRGKIFTNARCGDISRVKFLRMVNKELINNHTPIYLGKIFTNRRQSEKFVKIFPLENNPLYGILLLET